MYIFVLTKIHFTQICVNNSLYSNHNYIELDTIFLILSQNKEYIQCTY